MNGAVFYPTTVKANPAVANTTSWWSGGSGNYNALVVDLRHDLSHGLQFRANYTWAKNLDDGSAWNTSVSSNTPAFVEVPSLPHLDYGPAATDIRHLAAFNTTYDLPFGAHKEFFANAGSLVNHTISGWTLSTIANLSTGFPFSPQLGYNPTGSGDSRNPVRPNVNPTFNGSLYNHGTTAQRANQYFNPSAFSAPAAGFVGNAGRDNLVGPGFADWDLSLLKSTQITEAVRLQFRAEFFNILTTPTSRSPTRSSTPPAPRKAPQPTRPRLPHSAHPHHHRYRQHSRQIQLGLKLLF